MRHQKALSKLCGCGYTFLYLKKCFKIELKTTKLLQQRGKIVLNYFFVQFLPKNLSLNFDKRITSKHDLILFGQMNGTFGLN